MHPQMYVEHEPLADPIAWSDEQSLPELVRMEAGESLLVDPSNPLAEYDDLHKRPLLARVYAGNDSFAVLAQRWDESERRAAGPYFLVREVPDAHPDDPVEFANFTNSRAIVGRAWQGNPFNSDGALEQEHFQIRHGRYGIHVTNYSRNAQTVLEQAEPLPTENLRVRLREWAASMRQRVGQAALAGAEYVRSWSSQPIRAERADSRLRRFLGGVARMLVEPDVTMPETFDVVYERNRRIAAAAAELHGPSDNQAPRIHRRPVWVAGNKRRYDDGVTDSARKEFDEQGVHDDHAPYGYFRDTRFPIIGRDSPTVRGGIFVSRGREAILVDDQSPQMQEAAAEMVDRIWQMINSGQPATDRDILWAVREYTRERMPYCAEDYDNLATPLARRSGILPISELLDRRYAICNGQTPFGVSMIESLIDAGLMFGRVSAERKIDKRTGVGHATPAFDPLGNDNPDNVLVVDLSGRDGFVGTRDEARAAGYWYDFDLPAAA